MSATAEVQVSEAIDGFTAGIRGRVLRPGDEGYDEARMVHNGMFDKRPLAVMKAEQVGDVGEPVGAKHAGAHRRPVPTGTEHDRGCRRVEIVEVIDNGVGVAPENLTRIFAHGFTTRREGHGFGLHSGALAARELGGSLTVISEGTGKGAEFTLLLPRKGIPGHAAPTPGN
jgi:nitrogen fixation/metabolism regulation signal transduction histidine kinase